MQVSKKEFNKVLQKLRKDLFSGRKSFKFLKETCYKMFKSSSELWQNQTKPITKKDFENRKLLMEYISLASSMYGAIKEANKYRASLRFRNCKYVKYFDKNRLIFECSFYKIATKENKINCFIIYLNKRSNNGFKAELINGPIEIKSPISEEGKFRHIPIFFTEYNVFFYPKNGKQYSFNFKGKTRENMTAKVI